MPIKKPTDQIAWNQEPTQKTTGLIWQELNSSGDLIETWNWINEQWQSNIKSFTGSIYSANTNQIWGLPISSLYNCELISWFTQVGNPQAQNWTGSQPFRSDIIRGDNSGAVTVTSSFTNALLAGTYINVINSYTNNKFSTNNQSYLQVRTFPTNVTYNFVFQLNYKLIRK